MSLSAECVDNMHMSTDVPSLIKEDLTHRSPLFHCPNKVSVMPLTVSYSTGIYRGTAEKEKQNVSIVSDAILETDTDHQDLSSPIDVPTSSTFLQ